MSELDEDTSEADHWDTPPWERPGACRYDAEQHRGALLRRLANASFVIATISCCPCLCICAGFVVRDDLLPLIISAPAMFLGLVGGVPGLVATRLGKHDLRQMRNGFVDPNGEMETRFAVQRATWGALLGFASVLFWGTVALWSVLM